MRRLFLACFLVFVTLSSALAQESTEPVEPPTATLTPEPPTLTPLPPTPEPPTFTPLPTDTATALPTATLTETSTETPTASATITSSETATPTETATATSTATPTATETIDMSLLALDGPTATPTCQVGTLWDAWWGYPNPLPDPSTLPGSFQIVKGSFSPNYSNNDNPRGVVGAGAYTLQSELEVLWTFPSNGWVTSIELQLLKSRNGGSEISAGYSVYLDDVLVGTGDPARAGLDNWTINLDVPDGWYSSMRVEMQQTRTSPFAVTFFARAIVRSTCINASTPTPTPTATLTPTFTPTPCGGESGMMALSGMCEIPSPTPTATPNPLELGYYERFKGLIFWIIYNETSENSMVERFDIVENAIANSDPNDPNRVVSVPDLAAYMGEERENLRLPYLFARVVLDHISAYAEVVGNESVGFEAGFNYGRNWGGSINNPAYDIWKIYRGCLDTHGYAAELPPYESVYIGGGVRALDWLSDYINCLTEVNPEYLNAYQQISPFINRAIEHHIAGIPNPIAGTEYIRNANSCFWFRLDGGCAYVKEVPQFCDTEGMNCRPSGVFTEGVFVAPISGDVFNTWLTNYLQLPQEYRSPGTPGYLFSAEDLTEALEDNTAVEQLTYATQIGMQYSVSVGLRGEGQDVRYILMGVGTNRAYGTENIEQTFARHWNRLNRDRNPDSSPETYRPNFCLTGMIHATFGTSIFEQWVSFTFQSQEVVNLTYDNWFCEG